jgi:hypothetical protein
MLAFPQRCTWLAFFSSILIHSSWKSFLVKSFHDVSQKVSGREGGDRDNSATIEDDGVSTSCAVDVVSQLHIIATVGDGERSGIRDARSLADQPQQPGAHEEQGQGWPQKETRSL